MRLYHGSNQIISHIDLTRSKAFKDFGRGFYMTKDYARAVAMAQRTTAIEDTGNPEVTPYLFYPQKCPQDIKILQFNDRSAEWALFVLNNRDKNRAVAFKHEYDIVIGPVADSRVDAILCDYKEQWGEEYDNNEHLRRLADVLTFPGTDYIQYCFCTTKGVEQLIIDL